MRAAALLVLALAAPAWAETTPRASDDEIIGRIAALREQRDRALDDEAVARGKLFEALARANRESTRAQRETERADAAEAKLKAIAEGDKK